MDVNSISSRKQRSGWTCMHLTRPAVCSAFPTIPSNPKGHIPGHGRRQRTQGAWEAYCHHRGRRIEWLRDDSLPSVQVYSGTENLFRTDLGAKSIAPKLSITFRPAAHFQRVRGSGAQGSASSHVIAGLPVRYGGRAQTPRGRRCADESYRYSKPDGYRRAYME